jgi:hypothetical protein
MKFLSHPRTYIAISLVTMSAWAHGAALDLVVSQEERQAIIGKVQGQMVKKDPVTRGQYDTIPLLFAGGGGGMANATTVVDNVENLSDAELLNLIAKQKVAKGVIRMDGQDYLSFPFGKIKLGGGFKGTYGTKEYTVYVTSIDKHAYTLKYNEESKVIPLETLKGKLTKNN